MLLLLMIETAAISPPISCDAPQCVRSLDDYPPEALAKGWEGDVKVDLTVGINGRVVACQVTQSSGHAVLDDATCQTLTARARFLPATDKEGRPIESHYQQHIDWHIAH